MMPRRALIARGTFLARGAFAVRGTPALSVVMPPSLSVVMPAFFPLSCPAKAGHPVTRARRLKPKRCRAERPAMRTGSSAFADDDNRETSLACRRWIRTC